MTIAPPDGGRLPEPPAPLEPVWYPSVIESIAEAVLAWDSEGRVLVANRRATDLLGLDLAQLRGEAPFDRRWAALDLDGRVIDAERLPVHQVLRASRSGRFSHGIRRGDGSVVWVKSTIEVVDGASGPGVPAAVATVHDATEDHVGRAVDRSLLRMATRLVERGVDGTGPTVVDEHLADLGALAAAHRVILVAVEPESGRARVSHDWRPSAEVGPIPVTEVTLDQLPRLLARLARREVVPLDGGDPDPPLDGLDDALRLLGIDHALLAPVLVGERLHAFVVVGWTSPGTPDERVRGGVAVAAELLAARFELERVHADLRELTVTLDDRVRARSAELQDEKDRISALVDAIPDVIFEIDADGLFVDVHAPDESMLVMPAASFVGRPASEVMDFAIQPDVVRSVGQRVRADGSAVAVVEYTTDVLDGTSRTFECRVVPRASGGMVAVIRDITGQAEQARLQAEHAERLARANEELERAVQAKDEFLAGVGHELRTPLSAILGLAEILLEDEAHPLTRAQHSAVETVRASGAHLLSLINDLLDLEQLGNRRSPLDVAELELAEVVGLALDLVAPTASRDGVALEVHRSDDLPSIRGDRRRLRQVVLNLLENGVKFTPAGGTVGVDLWCPDADTVACTVWDTGIGLDPQDHRRVFEPFVQVDAGADRRYVGSGLGLTLAERFARLHGGRLEVSSALGQGARFTLVLPVAGPLSAIGET